MVALEESGEPYDYEASVAAVQAAAAEFPDADVRITGSSYNLLPTEVVEVWSNDHSIARFTITQRRATSSERDVTEGTIQNHISQGEASQALRLGMQHVLERRDESEPSEMSIPLATQKGITIGRGPKQSNLSELLRAG